MVKSNTRALLFLLFFVLFCFVLIVASNFFVKRNMYLAVLGLICGMWDLFP